MTKFKIGDRVRIKEISLTRFKVGDVVEIIDTGDLFDWKVKRVSDGEIDFFDEYELSSLNPLEDLKAGQVITNGKRKLTIIKKAYKLENHDEDYGYEYYDIPALKEDGYHLYTPRKVVTLKDGSKYRVEDIIKNCKSI